MTSFSDAFATSASEKLPRNSGRWEVGVPDTDGAFEAPSSPGVYRLLSAPLESDANDGCAL